MICSFLSCLGCGRKSDLIQKREAYFGCIAALDGSSEVRAPAERPFSSWPASSAPPRSSRVRAGVAGQRKSSADSQPGGGHEGQTRGWGEDGHQGWRADARLPVITTVSGTGSSGAARPVPGILTESWVESGRAGVRWQGLTTGPRVRKHLAALDEIVNGTVDLCDSIRLVLYCSSFCIR